MTDTPLNIPTTAPRSSTLDQLVALLASPDGATMAQMMAATGWQAHSVRGAMAGALKKKGHVIVSEAAHTGRIWRITGANLR